MGPRGWVRFLISDGADTRLLTKETDAGQLIVFRIDVPNPKTITPGADAIFVVGLPHDHRTAAADFDQHPSQLTRVVTV